jgi:hypothetical protein
MICSDWVEFDPRQSCQEPNRETVPDNFVLPDMKPATGLVNDYLPAAQYLRHAFHLSD